MVEPGNGPDELALAVAARHALHDEELVAGFATGSLDDTSELARAQQLIDRCSACRDLHRDVAAIGGALRGSAKFTGVAPRDFRLSVEDAVRLGGTVSPRGALAGLRKALAGFAKPLGASMTALGLVGLVIGSVTLVGDGAAPLQVDTGATGSTAGAEVQPGAAQASPAGSTARTTAINPLSTFDEDGDDGSPREREGDATTSPRVLLLGGSLGLLAAGVLLLGIALRRGRRHRTGG